jgi:hypothetical protein
MTKSDIGESMASPHQIVVLLDVAMVGDDEVIPLLPKSYHARTILRLSEENHTKPIAPGAMKGPYDWDALGRAIENLAEKALSKSAQAGGRAVLYVAGRAPLPLFVQLGFSLNKFSGETWVLNSHRGGPWISYPLVATPRDSESPFFDEVNGLPPNGLKATGVVSVYVSTIGAPAPEQAFLETLDQIDHNSAGIVEIRTSAPGDVLKENIGRLMDELSRELPRIKDTYPHSEGMALFIAGPIPLAFAAGRALNFHAQRDVWVMNYDRERIEGPAYEVAVTLPFRASVPAVSDEAADRLARREALEAILEGVEELRKTLQEKDLAPGSISSLPRRCYERLKQLSFPRDPEANDFTLRIAKREMSIGKGLLEAVREAPVRTRHRFAQLLVLHELYHDGQDLRSSNHSEVARAGVVIEEVDFWADSFALETLIAWDLRRGGPRAQERAHEIATDWLDTAAFGIEAFDRFDQGARIERLYERRLRRYLIWHLQHQRAATVRTSDDVHALFRDRLFVELGPLDGALDARGEKLIKQARHGRTEIFAVLRGQLIRRGPRPDFEPSDLVNAVRSFQRAQIRQTMQVLVEEHRAVLVPWAE